jgi:hypothetical protein
MGTTLRNGRPKPRNRGGKGRFDEIDIENVAERIRSLGDSRFQAARPQLWRVLTRLIQQKIHSRNAMRSAGEHRL